MDRKFDADLHNHTTFSDGEYTPEEIVKLAKQLGLKAIAITDHDTIDGVKEAVNSANGIEVIAGTEITVRYVKPFFKGSVHLLVYFPEFLLKIDDFIQETGEILAKGRGLQLTRDRIEAINREFYSDLDSKILSRPLTEDDVYQHGQRISRRHFALALNGLGITEKSLVNQIIGNDSPAYIPSGIELGLLKNYLNSWPFVKILAHPAAGSFPGESHYKEVCPSLEVMTRLIPDFIALGIDGFEVNYPAHTPELRKKLIALMDEYHLPLATGGSDCHDRIERPLGVEGVNYSVVKQIKQVWRERDH